jgi:hypothetical protein
MSAFAGRSGLILSEAGVDRPAPGAACPKGIMAHPTIDCCCSVLLDAPSRRACIRSFWALDPIAIPQSETRPRARSRRALGAWQSPGQMQRNCGAEPGGPAACPLPVAAAIGASALAILLARNSARRSTHFVRPPESGIGASDARRRQTTRGPKLYPQMHQHSSSLSRPCSARGPRDRIWAPGPPSLAARSNDRAGHLDWQKGKAALTLNGWNSRDGQDRDLSNTSDPSDAEAAEAQRG